MLFAVRQLAMMALCILSVHLLAKLVINVIRVLSILNAMHMMARKVVFITKMNYYTL